MVISQKNFESGCPIRKRKLIHRDFVVEDRASSRPFMFGRWTNKRMVEAFSLPLSRCSNAKNNSVYKSGSRKPLTGLINFW